MDSLPEPPQASDHLDFGSGGADFGLLVSTTVRKYTSVVLRDSDVIICYSFPRKWVQGPQ